MAGGLSEFLLSCFMFQQSNGDIDTHLLPVQNCTSLKDWRVCVDYAALRINRGTKHDLDSATGGYFSLKKLKFICSGVGSG